MVKIGVQAVESSDFLIDLLHFNAVVEFDSGDDLGQVMGSGVQRYENVRER